MSDPLRARLATLVERERGLNHADDAEYRAWLSQHGDRCAVNYMTLVDELTRLLRETAEAALRAAPADWVRRLPRRTLIDDADGIPWMVAVGQDAPSLKCVDDRWIAESDLDAAAPEAT